LYKQSQELELSWKDTASDSISVWPNKSQTWDEPSSTSNQPTARSTSVQTVWLNRGPRNLWAPQSQESNFYHPQEGISRQWQMIEKGSKGNGPEPYLDQTWPRIPFVNLALNKLLSHMEVHCDQQKTWQSTSHNKSSVKVSSLLGTFPKILGFWGIDLVFRDFAK